MTRTVGPRILTGLVLGLLLAVAAQAVEDRQELENSLFSDSAGTTPPAAAAEPATTSASILDLKPDAKSVGFSGQITSAIVDLVSNTLDANFLYTYTVADVFLDARLPQNAKVFADLEATYLAQNQLTLVALQELFFDFNLAQSVYFRTGKQVLQWGRCYLWNPTDLINIERPHFIRKIGTREGAYGLKTHVPFGAGLNLYSFIDTGSVPDAEHTAGALKVEYLLGNLEMALSGWGKKGHLPVWGLDFSTRLFGIDTLGEVALSEGPTQARARVEQGQLVLAAAEPAWAPRAALDFSRSFTVGNFKDQLTVMLEGYYDRAGYDTNVLADTTEYPFAQPVTTLGPNGPVVVNRGTQKDFINLQNLYRANYFSRSYVALFITFGRFLLTDMTLNVNYIRNLVDDSGLVSAGVTYTALNSFTFGLLADAITGGPDREYSFSGEKFDLQATFGISF
jgi:hypothetical protein